jgi:CRP/FNR family transcriptional regulator, cyclic AMP receptor protein
MKTIPKTRPSTLQQAFQAVLSPAGVKRVSKGTILYYQGEVPREGCFILKGCIKAYNLSTEGEEQLVGFHLKDEFVPNPWLFGYTAGTTYFYEAFTDCEVINVSRVAFQETLQENESALRAALDYYIKNYIGSLMRITALGQSKAAAKIMYTFYYLAQRYGVRLSNKKTRLNIKLTHQQFAHLVGLTRETTATEMKRLHAKGIISYKAQTYIIDVPKLLLQMGEEGFEQV